MPDSPGERLAVLAIDPSSPVSRCALLGDRVRLNEDRHDARLYFRSLASRGGQTHECDRCKEGGKAHVQSS